MKQHDCNRCKAAMIQEVNDQLKNGNFEVIPKSNMPSNATILPAVWKMKHKGDIATRKIKKYKTRLNIDGSKQIKGRDYQQTYAPVASWPSIRFLLTLATVHSWKTTQLDFVSAYLQALIEQPMFMAIPKGFDIENGTAKDHVLRLKRKIYGQRQAGRVWNDYLVAKLKRIGFT